MESLFSLDGKVAIVTGGARGLGRMMARGLLNAGATVYLTSREADDCLAATADLGGQSRALHGDAGSPKGIAELGRKFRQAGERKLHILINNVGRTRGAPLESFPDDAWASVMSLNVQAPFRMIQEMLPELQAAASLNDPARVINIGSIAGRAVTELKAYSYMASKAAIHQLTRQLAKDLIERHINVNAILPGFFPTAMTAPLRDRDSNLQQMIPMGRMGDWEDIAGAAVFLSSRAGSYVTGIELPVDGGIIGCR
jgi:NAD(P)-dependent dehydrogenase (short-subunit alcohol dehydrogenase family)